MLFAPSPTTPPPPGYKKSAPTAPQAPKKSNLELMMENFTESQTQ